MSSNLSTEKTDAVITAMCRERASRVKMALSQSFKRTVFLAVMGEEGMADFDAVIGVDRRAIVKEILQDILKELDSYE